MIERPALWRVSLAAARWGHQVHSGQRATGQDPGTAHGDDAEAYMSRRDDGELTTGTCSVLSRVEWIQWRTGLEKR